MEKHNFQLGDYIYSSFKKRKEDIAYIAKINKEKQYNKYVVCKNGLLEEIFSETSINPVTISDYFLRNNGYIWAHYVPQEKNECGGYIYTKKGYPTIFRSDAVIGYSKVMDVTYENKEYRINYVHELQQILRENNLCDRFKF